MTPSVTAPTFESMLTRSRALPLLLTALVVCMALLTVVVFWLALPDILYGVVDQVEQVRGVAPY